MADNFLPNDKTEPLLNERYEDHEKNKTVYVIQFPNPSDQSQTDLDEHIELRKARKQMFKVFKTSLKIQRPQDKIKKGVITELDSANSPSKTDVEKKNDSEAIPDMVKKKVKWLFSGYHGEEAKKSDSNEQHHDQHQGHDNSQHDIDTVHSMTRRNFLKDIISAVLYTIEYELNLKYTLLLSRDKDEIFCEIYAEEEWLKSKAQALGYRLQLKKDENLSADHLRKYPFKQVSPYAKFEIPKNFIGAEEIFTHFNENEKIDNTNGKTLFTYNDKVRLIRSSLNSRLDLHIMKEFMVSIEDFCIHLDKPLEELKKNWAHPKKVCASQPLHKIRDYFGEKIGLYFAWMEMYKRFMIVAGVVGLVIQIILLFRYFEDLNIEISQYCQVFFALFLAFWASAFDQMWGRREKILAWEWGTTNFYEEEEQRGEFKGKMIRDPVSNKMKRKVINPLWSNAKRFISYSVIMVILVSVLAIVWGIMAARWSLKLAINDTGLIIAGIINAVQIRIMNLVFDKIATWLNDWENHETETEYNNRLAVKIFIFRFFNSYTSLFYLSYNCEEAQNGGGIDSCMDFLGIQLAVIFFFSIILNIIEISVPYLLMKRRMISEDMKVKNQQKEDSTIREKLFPVEAEAKRESYESPLFDYIEMIIEFGYVALFGTSLPVLPLLLLFEILFEIRVDAWKICNIYKRADPHRSEDIGVFKDIILIMAYVGAINNSGLIIFTSGIVKNILANTTFSNEPFSYLVAFVVLEHVLLIGMFLISVLIPDNPEMVEKGLIWSERMINEKLYKANNEIKYTLFKSIIQDAVEKKAGSSDFLLREDHLNNTET